VTNQSLYQRLFIFAFFWLLVAADRALCEKPIRYSRDIQPLLSNSCYACHGPDESSREAELRLDLTETALERVIVPGRPEDSEVIARITSDDPDVHMPPHGSGRPSLKPDQIELVRTWIREGAKVDGHWAYESLRKPSLPNSGVLSSNPIDDFLLVDLRDAGITPAPEADRRTLIRRLYYDITGLPPSPEAVQAFVDDNSTDAYERVVDQLLASPHYGERMGVFWLDQVRYADSSGIHNDYERDHYLLRDYVINAFNSNKPFDRFTVEQLAGDLLPDAGREQRIAAAYNRLNLSTEESGSQEKEFRAKYAADRVRNASSVWMAATLGCAECHDHKFDPYSQRDFYCFAAFFADIQEPAVTLDPPTIVPTAEQQVALDDLQWQIDDLQRQLDTPTPELIAAEQRWEAALEGRAIPWLGAPVVGVAAEHATLNILEDGSVLASGTNADSESFEIETRVDLPNVTAVRIDVLADPSLPSGGPGRAPNGNFVLTDIRLSARPADRSGEEAADFAAAYASFSQEGSPSEAAIDSDPQTGWGGFDRSAEDHFGVFVLSKPLSLEGRQEVRVQLRFNSPHKQHNLGRFRLAFTAASSEDLKMAGRLPNKVAQALAVSRENRSSEQQSLLIHHFMSVCEELKDVRNKQAELRAERERKLTECPKLLMTVSGEPRVTRILPRGNWQDDSGDIVAPAIPTFLGTLPIEGRRATRLDLAQWLVSARNPLTARVIVNRFWNLAFGQGLAATLDDFGVQGAWPSNDQLLDWLAADFVEHDWDVKRLLKTIFMSSAYRRSSVPITELSEKDPANALFGRQNRFRMDAEFIRDAALSVGNLMSPQIGGRSVKPYQPDGYWAYLNYPTRDYVPDSGEQQYRRGLYTHWQRTLPHPSLLAFDAPNRETCVVRRNRSNTPLQSLVLLNDPTYVEVARALAEQLARKEFVANDAAKVNWLLQRVLSRDARSGEVVELAELHQRHLLEFRADPSSAEKLTAVGNRPISPDIDRVELAAWTSVARAVLNSHAFVTRN